MKDAPMHQIKTLVLNDPETKSADIVAGNVEALKMLFPEAFTEGAIDFEVLKGLLGSAVDERDEKYGLNWHGKRRARQIALTPSTGTLLPCPEESVDWDTTQNLMIEGDNLEVLKLLQKSYAGKVKLIFIDPPYNTGGDFIYPDDFRNSIRNYIEVTKQSQDGRKVSSNTESSGRFHTDWLSMMYPRLKLAKNLLRLDGVMFITIDDHEIANLRAILDEIFGEENFVATVAWQKVFAKKNKALISGSHDHVMVVTRDVDQWSRNLLPRTEEQKSAFRNLDNDPRGLWQSVSFSVQSEDSEKRKAYRYQITLPSGRSVMPPAGRHWNGLPNKFEDLRKDNRLWFGSDGDSPPRQKVFLSEVQDGIVPDTWWTHEECGNNQEAKKEILELFGDSEPFSTPKPTRLIQRMLAIGTSGSDDLVLDFFAGSGTTAQSVYQANAGDSGTRRFILVQLPEPTGRRDYATISDITKERIRRAAKKVSAESPLFKGDLGFRAFKLASSNIRAWEPDATDLESSLLKNAEHLVQGRKELDVLYELLLKLGLDLCVPILSKEIAGKTVHSIGGGALIVCLADGLTKDVVEQLANGIVQWRAELAPAVDARVVFKDSGFADDVAKSNMAAILHQNGMIDVRSL